jgi:hypothetical protein
MSDISAENVTTIADSEVAEGYRLFEQLEAQLAQITDADKMEAQFLNGSDRRIRRAALLTLEKSGQQLIDGVTRDRGTAVAMARVSSAAMDYAKSLHQFAEIMESASIRIRLALCSRSDMEAVLKDAAEVPKVVEVAHV